MVLLIHMYVRIMRNKHTTYSYIYTHWLVIEFALCEVVYQHAFTLNIPEWLGIDIYSTHILHHTLAWGFDR